MPQQSPVKPNPAYRASPGQAGREWRGSVAGRSGIFLTVFIDLLGFGMVLLPIYAEPLR
jgi:hypothetical protein